MLLVGAGAPISASPTAHRAAPETLNAPCSGLGGPLPIGTGPCPGVRPGGFVVTDEGACTLNFLFRDRQGRRYIGTAGHCTLAADGEQLWRGNGPQARLADGSRFGEFVYAILMDPYDFVLIAIDANVQAKAKMCFFGGPTGINQDRTQEVTTLEFYGNGAGVGRSPVGGEPTLPARSALAKDFQDPNVVIAYGPAILGDSGSGVISSDGRAVGALVGASAQGVVITRLMPQLKRAEGRMGLELTLQRAPHSQ